MLSDPFGTDRGDFPLKAYHMFLRDESVALLESGADFYAMTDTVSMWSVYALYKSR